MAKIKNTTRNKINLYLDILLVLAFAIDLELRFTGLTIHEWLGVGIAVVCVIHLILHWSWFVGLTKTFFRKLIHDSRLRYILAILTFIDIAVITVSGILISRTLGLNFNVRGPGQLPWERIHVLSAEFGLILVGLHIASAWQWIITNSKKYLLSFKLPGNRKLTTTVSEPTSSATEV